MSEAEITGHCGSCQRPFDDDEVARLTSGGEGRPCDACGEQNPVIEVSVQETVSVKESVRMRAKPEVGRWIKEITSGDSLYRRTQTWHQIHRVIDRENDLYEEHITDADGNVVRDVSGRLSEHLGHGSDRSQPKAHP